jgi:hypothetical protein
MRPLVVPFDFVLIIDNYNLQSYYLINQPTQKSLYGDLSITGLVGDSLERQAL